VILRGRVESGQRDAGRWLAKFNDAYARKTGMPIFPGSLNLALEVPFDWLEPALQSAMIYFPGREFGAERDILMLPCRLRSLRSLRGFLWTTTNGASDPTRRGLVEIIASENLRDRYGLRDGDLVEVEVLAAGDAATEVLEPR
jgi:CTP-dependent riboflavin kinase